VMNDPVDFIDPLGLCYQSRDEQSWNCWGVIIGGDTAASQWQPILWDLLDGVYVPLSMIDRLSVTGAAIGWAGPGERVAANNKLYAWVPFLIRINCSSDQPICSNGEEIWGLVEVGEAESPSPGCGLDLACHFYVGFGDFILNDRPSGLLRMGGAVVVAAGPQILGSLAALPTVQVAVGAGAPPFSHVAFNAGSGWLHASGGFFNMTITSRGATAWITKFSWFIFHVPVLNPSAVSAAAGSAASSCVTGACSAILRGWLR
jgi:hypothetical protein